MVKNLGVVCGLLLTCGLFCAGLRAQESAPQRPNILFILTDDQTFDAVHALGNREIITPNIDRLVKSGTTFTHAFNMGSWTGAVCVASRTMLLTGVSLWHAEALPKDLADAQKQGRLWPQRMKAAGYATYFAGKWHTGSRPEKVFDVVGRVRGGMPAQTPQGYNRPLEGQPDPWSPSDPKFGGNWEGGKHWSEALADDGVEFLRRAAEKPQPFFMYLAFNAPHDPRQSPQAYVDRYKLADLAVPASYLPEYPDGEAIGAGRSSRDEQLGPFPRTEFAVKTHRREYFASTTFLDEQVGRILAALEKTGRAANTVVVFTSDHGLAIGQHGLLGKQNMYDHSLRVPFVMSGPGITADRRISAPIYLQDVLPTTLELAGAAVPEDIEFRSLLPLLRGPKPQSPYAATYGGYRNVQRSIRNEDYKLILYPPLKKVLLFDLHRDPLEITDISARPENRAVLKLLFSELLTLQKKLGDKLDLAAVYPDFKP